MTTLPRQVRLLILRNLREGVRNPVLAYGIPVIIPLAVLVLVAKTLSAVTSLPGFPTDNYAEWMTPPIIMLTAMTGVGYAATGLMVDIGSGFIDRLRLLDAHPAALLTSRMLFDVFRVLPAGGVLLGVGAVMGTDVNEGLRGVLVLFGLLTVWAVAYGGLFFLVALSTRNAQAPLALAPLFLPLQFLSTQFVPEVVLPGWARTAAAWNPFAYMVDASRVLVTGPYAAEPVARAFAVALLMLLLTLVASHHLFARAVAER